MDSLGCVQEAATSKGVPEFLGENPPRSQGPSRHPADPHAIRTGCLQSADKRRHAYFCFQRTKTALLMLVFFDRAATFVVIVRGLSWAVWTADLGLSPLTRGRHRP